MDCTDSLIHHISLPYQVFIFSNLIIFQWWRLSRCYDYRSICIQKVHKQMCTKLNTINLTYAIHVLWTPRLNPDRLQLLDNGTESIQCGEQMFKHVTLRVVWPNPSMCKLIQGIQHIGARGIFGALCILNGTWSVAPISFLEFLWILFENFGSRERQICWLNLVFNLDPIPFNQARTIKWPLVGQYGYSSICYNQVVSITALKLQLTGRLPPFLWFIVFSLVFISSNSPVASGTVTKIKPLSISGHTRALGPLHLSRGMHSIGPLVPALFILVQTGFSASPVAHRWSHDSSNRNKAALHLLSTRIPTYNSCTWFLTGVCCLKHGKIHQNWETFTVMNIMCLYSFSG